MSDWPLVVASNITAALHRPRCQNSVCWIQLCSLLSWTVAKCRGLVWQSLQPTDLKRGRLKSQSHRADGRNSILRPVTFWMLAQMSTRGWDCQAAPHKQHFLAVERRKSKQVSRFWSKWMHARMTGSDNWLKGRLSQGKRKRKKVLVLFCLLLTSKIQKWSPFFFFCAISDSQNKLSKRLQLRDVFFFPFPNFTTSAQKIIRPLFIYLAPFQTERITKHLNSLKYSTLFCT